MIENMSKKQIIQNRFYARKNSTYEKYIIAGGSGSRRDYELLCEINQIKADKLEKLLESVYGDK